MASLLRDTDKPSGPWACRGSENNFTWGSVNYKDGLTFRRHPEDQLMEAPMGCKAEYATFLMKGKSNGQPVNEDELKEVASRLATALKNRNFSAGEVFGSSTDLWGFAVATDACEILVDVTPPENTFDKRWSIQAMLADPGWFKATRDKRLAELKRVEWGIHEALSDELRADDIGWLLGDGRVKDRARQSTP